MMWDQQEEVKQDLIECQEGTVCAAVRSAHVSLHVHVREGDVDLGAQADGGGAHTPVGAVQPRRDPRRVRHHRHESCERNTRERASGVTCVCV